MLLRGVHPLKILQCLRAPRRSFPLFTVSADSIFDASLPVALHARPASFPASSDDFGLRPRGFLCNIRPVRGPPGLVLSVLRILRGKRPRRPRPARTCAISAVSRPPLFPPRPRDFRFFPPALGVPPLEPSETVFLLSPSTCNPPVNASERALK